MEKYLFNDRDETWQEINDPLEMTKILKGKLVVFLEPNGDIIVLVGNDYDRHSALIADYLKQVHGVEVQRYFRDCSEEIEMREKLEMLGLTSMGGMDIDSLPARYSQDNIATTRITGRSSLLGPVKLEVLEQIVPHIFKDPELALSWERMKV